MTRSTRKLLVALAGWALFFWWASPAGPASIVVTGSCDLAEAIAAANGDTMVGGCAAGSGADDIHLTGNVLLQDELSSAVSEIVIYGHGYEIHRSVTAEEFRIFRVQSGGELTLHDLGIFFGRANLGGAIYNQGNLTLFNTRVAFNRAEARGGGIFNTDGRTVLYDSEIIWNVAEGDDFTSGGGIRNSDGALEIVDSRISLNSSVGDAASGGAGGGGVSSLGDLFVSRSTISENTVRGKSASGAGISALPSSVDSTVVIVNSTFSGNDAIDETAPHSSLGGGLAAAAEVWNTTFHGNQADYGTAISGLSVFGKVLVISRSLLGGSAGALCDGTVTDGGDNLADAATCLSVDDGLVGLDSTLADNGGPTMTHALASDSTAINIAGGCGLESDQRGAGRTGLCDSGAYEWIPCELLDLDEMVIYGPAATIEFTCDTALLGPDLLIDGPTEGDLQVTAGYRIIVKNGFEIQNGAALTLGLGP